MKPFGPVQLYVALVTEDAVRLIFAFAHTGPLLPTTGTGGVWFTATVVCAGRETQPATVAVTV